LDAVERLLEDGDHRKLTAGAVAREARVAHGTFYRYFKDRGDALHQVLDRIAEEAERLRGDFSAAELGSLEDERARLRLRCEEALRKRSAHRGLMRAWFALSAMDSRIAQLRRERIERAVVAWSAYLDRLRARGYACFTSESRDVAVVLLTLLEAAMRRAVVDEEALDEGGIAATVEMVERAVFGDPNAIVTSERTQ